MYADIILLAIISLFLVVKLIMILGQKDINAPESRFAMGSAKPEAVIVLDKNLAPKDRLKLLDPGFNEATFLGNAEAAVKIVLEAYGHGSTRVLAELMDIEVLKKFAYPISMRDEQGLSCDINVVKIDTATIEDIKIEDNIVDIIVRFTVEAVMTVTDLQQKIVAGHANKIEKISDAWTFRRNVRSSDPTWKLVAVGVVPLT